MIGPSVRSVRWLNLAGTVFTAELHGLLLAVDHIIQTSNSPSVMYTDSLSALQTLTSLTTPKNALIILLQKKIVAATRKGCNILFCWVSSHVGIPGNKKVDRAASTCGTRAVDISSLPFRDYYALLKYYAKSHWQSEWNLQVENKLHMVKPFLSEWKSARHEERFFEVILSRLRIGHTRLMHGFLLPGEERPE